MRKALDLYANLRPIANLPHVRSRFEHVDLVIVRENTEDLYSGLEHEVVPGVVESLKIITERASTRIARFAFDYARRLGRRRVTAIHKANIMKMRDGLFIRCGPRRRGGVSRRGLRRTDRGRRLHASGDEAGKIRRRCSCRICTATSSRICAPVSWAASASSAPPTSAKGSGLRSGTRQRTGYCRQEPREPDRSAAFGADDAGSHRRVETRRAASRPRSFACSRRPSGRHAISAGKRLRPSSRML